MARDRGSAGAEASGPSTGAQVGAGWFAAFFVPMLLLGGIFVFGLRKFLRERVAAVIASGDEPVEEVNAASFDQRIAARLRELEGGQGAVTAPQMPAARTFGRKLA
jgi:hypothetical protein